MNCLPTNSVKNNDSCYGGLYFSRVNSHNAKEAIIVQNDIFPDWDATLHILAACDMSILSRNLPDFVLNIGKVDYYLAKLCDEIIGMTGIYTYTQTTLLNECWLGWYGVRPPFRKAGYGKTILDWTISQAISEGFDILRLYSSESYFPNAIKLYGKLGFECESYKAEGGIYDKLLIFSMQLSDKPIELLNNRFMNFAAETELCNPSNEVKEEILLKYKDIRR